MTSGHLRKAIKNAIWRAADRSENVISATLTGSFVASSESVDFSDIDTVLITDSLNQEIYNRLLDVFRHELEPLFNSIGLSLHINTFFGPLKFNTPKCAVLHLMIYDAAAHRKHAIESPFTCLDWQRSQEIEKRSLHSIFPVFGLQPSNFFNSRRSASNYLLDLKNGTIGYRSLSFHTKGRLEEAHVKEMDHRDQVEFAYHVMRFLMLNFLKLVDRHNLNLENGLLLQRYNEVFPLGMDHFGPLFLLLGRLKKDRDYSLAGPGLYEKLRNFVECFERQFRLEFESNACRQIWIRHAPTRLNTEDKRSITLQGRLDEDIAEMNDCSLEKLRKLSTLVQDRNIAGAITSTLRRSKSTASLISDCCERPLPIVSEPLLNEINYGTCDGETIQASLDRYPFLREGWNKGEDPRFPSGENSADVRARLRLFLEQNHDHKLIVTHNVVLRELIGDAFNIPQHLRYQLVIPHIAPFEVVHSARFGLFANIDLQTHEACFQNFFSP